MSSKGSSSVSDPRLVPDSSVPPYSIFTIRRLASAKPPMAASDVLPEGTADVQLNSQAEIDIKMGFDHTQHGMSISYYQMS